MTSPCGVGNAVNQRVERKMPFELIPRKAPKLRMDPAKVHLRSRTMNLKRKIARGGGAGQILRLCDRGERA